MASDTESFSQGLQSYQAKPLFHVVSHPLDSLLREDSKKLGVVHCPSEIDNNYTKQTHLDPEKILAGLLPSSNNSNPVEPNPIKPNYGRHPIYNYNLTLVMERRPSSESPAIKESLLTEPQSDQDITYEAIREVEQKPKEEAEKTTKAKNPRKVVSRLICNYTLKSPLLFVIANVAMVISSFGTIALPLICGLIIDDIKEKKSSGQHALFLLGLTIIAAVSSSIRGYCFNVLGEKVMIYLRLDLFKSLMDKDINYYDVHKSGQLVSRLTSDIGVVQSAASDNISNFLRSFIQLIGSIAFLWLISWPLTLGIVITTPIISVILLLIVRVLKRLKKQYQDKLADANSLATQIFGNIRIVKSFATEKKEYDHYNGLIAKTYEVGKKQSLAYAGMLFAIMIFGNGLVLGVLYYGGHLVITGDMTIGGLTSYVLYTITLTVGITSASAVLNQIISALGVCEKIFEIIDAPIQIINGTVSPRKNDREGGQIQFEGVSFSYPTKMDVCVLKDINMHINKGESLALVGASGSGKSSIVSLILRFYEVTQGRINYDGTPLVDYDLAELRKTIGYVAQQPTLFSGSLKENIEYGIDQQCSKQWMQKVLKMANAYEFVFNQKMFPEGLDTVVGERGVKLSGGQKQRIAIARCLIKKPKIMIFDQATSALDAESEYQVQTAIDGLLQQKDKTIIIIAHRLSTIMNCDRIVVLKEGEIVEVGKHYELLKNQSVYAALVDRQISGYHNSQSGQTADKSEQSHL